MKPFDSKGEYTADEVKAALAGVDGTRSLSFRYERLDNNNAFIEEIDYVQSCSIENNSLADIKRTAKFDILDVGRMDYLQDRIKPYIRITMPEEIRYSDIVKALSPSVWWKMDDASVTPAVAGSVTAPDDNSFNTMATADLIDLNVNNARKANLVTGSGTLRSEYWSYISTTTGRSFQVQLKNTGTQTVIYETYSATDLTSPATLVRTDIVPNGRDFTFGFVYPEVGVYAFRAVAQTATTAGVDLTVYRSNRFEDSTGNGINALASGLTMRAPSVLPDGGSSWSINNVYKYAVVDTIDVPLDGGLSMNFWHTRATDGLEVSLQWGVTNGYYQFYFSDDAVNGTYVCNFEFHTYDATLYPNFTGTITLPAGAFVKNTPQMVTLSAAKTDATLYVNGKRIGAIADASGVKFSDVSETLSTEHLNYGYIGSYSFGQSYFDDFTLYPKALRLPDVTNLFSYGLSGATQRSGFVEWPQGVFLLSSPKRTMVDGTYVHRDVEGYDSLVILKEDSFDYRYSVAAGTKYTDAVKNILQTSIAKQDYPLNEAQWTTTGGATVLNAYAATLTMDASSLNTSNNFSPLGLSMSSKVSFSTTDTSYTVDYKMITSTGDVFGFTITNGTTLAATGLGAVALKSATYSASTHAYLRLRESNNVLYFETSTNGSTWTQFITQAHTLSKTEPLRASIAANNAGAGDTLNVSSHRLTASIALQASIQATTKTLPTTLEWDIGTPKLDIINDLLTAINYETATYNENGIFTAKAYLSPDVRTSQYTYATDASSVIAGDVDQTIDLYKIPNKWVVVVSDPDRPTLMGSYTNTNPLSPTSTVSRGRTIVDYRDEQKAPDQGTLTAQAQRLAFEASQVFEVIEFETAIMPIHQNADVYTLVIDGLAVNSKFAEHSWSMDLEVGGTMKHTVRKVVSL